MDVVSWTAGGESSEVFSRDASLPGEARAGLTGAVEMESAVAVTITETPPSPALLTIPTPVSEGEGTGVEDSEGGVPSGWYGLQYE